MANVKVFADKETDQWTGQKLYTPNLLMVGQINRGKMEKLLIVSNFSFPLNALQIFVLWKVTSSMKYPSPRCYELTRSKTMPL